MDFIDTYFNFNDNLNIIGLTKELNSFYIVEKHKKSKTNSLVVTSTLYEANNYYENIKSLYNNVYLFPMDDFLNSVALAVSPELKVKRLETLDKIMDSNDVIVITNLMGFLKFLPSINNQKNYKLSINQEISKNDLIDTLEKFGYNKETIVTSTGEYASRGFIVDFFMPFEDYPIRVEFFGNVIESIRYFDSNTQISKQELKSLTLKTYTETTSKNTSSLIEYLQKPYIYLVNYDQIIEANKQLEEEIIEYKEKEDYNKDYKFMYELNKLPIIDVTYLSTFADNKYSKVQNINYQTKEIDNFYGKMEILKEKVVSYINNGKTVVFAINSKMQEKSLKDIFPNIVLTKKDNIIKNKINLIYLNVNKGFIFNDIILISQYDIESNLIKKTNYRNIYKIGRKIKDYEELKIGDYIVHYNHGIGRYNGIKTLNKNGFQKDYLQLIYKNNDKIYVPVEKIDTIFKYSDADGKIPKLNSLTSSSWQKTKQSLNKKIKDISQELIKIYALRKATKSPVYIDFPEEKLFEKDFKYEETLDQKKAIDDVLNDLKSGNPMDRLLCGDVGFGKTEVAFRGIFKTILNGYQVAYLCPTTILSSQQYKLALSRFSKYGINVALLNRFVTAKKQKEVIEKLKTGEIDLVFGTHRLLSDDIKFKKIGLLIVDEEQRFGVTHKEKIKKLKANVNILTLTATPIPRTLKMAISGLRDLSIIDTPPINRYPIQTYVLKENDLIVKDAIYKELSRNGQVYILYNDIKNIESKVKQIKQLVPEARINYAHGQMTKIEIENIMQDFIDYKFDVLICTTIIETGIDIPNTNSLIIYNADRFGLSQLYQIRGRVGRSDKIAYAYLLYNKNKVLNDIAVKRLQAIKEFTELGSGYKIAMRDIAIRGAGDILGSQQAGFVDSVGLELYIKMVNNEIKQLHGEKVEEIDLSDNTILNVNTHINDNYVDDEKLKIEIHKKINEINSYETLLKVKEEIEDRFGHIDEDLKIYMYEEWFEKIANSLNITKINQNKEFIEIELPEEISNTIAGDKLLIITNNLSRNFVLSYKFKRIYIKLYLRNLDKHFIYYLIELFTKLFPGK